MIEICDLRCRLNGIVSGRLECVKTLRKVVQASAQAGELIKENAEARGLPVEFGAMPEVIKKGDSFLTHLRQQPMGRFRCDVHHGGTVRRGLGRLVDEDSRWLRGQDILRGRSGCLLGMVVCSWRCNVACWRRDGAARLCRNDATSLSGNDAACWRGNGGRSRQDMLWRNNGRWSGRLSAKEMRAAKFVGGIW